MFKWGSLSGSFPPPTPYCRFSMRRTFTVIGCVAMIAAISIPMSMRAAEPKKKVDRPLERTRETVKMLDDIYKSAVVLITTHYVNEESDLAAGSAAIALFDAVKKKGWHEVRLLDATGDPIEANNSPQDAFEKAAVAKLKQGESWHEEVIEKDGKRYLRAATPVPVVLEKCTMCHDHYKQYKNGEPIGALSYTIRVR